jgi:hypothetical protein
VTRTVAVHLYVDDGARDHNDEGRCVTCRTPRRNAHHEVPDTSEATAAHDRRYLPEED